MLVLIVKQTTINTSNWGIYSLNKQYKNSGLHFKINYPKEWQFQEKPLSTEWHSAGSNDDTFTISWLNPDVTYDREDVCSVGECNKITAVKTTSGFMIEIWKPTPLRQKNLNLPDTFLQAEITNPDKLITIMFTTTSLSAENFKSVLSTFSFTSFSP